PAISSRSVGVRATASTTTGPAAPAPPLVGRLAVSARAITIARSRIGPTVHPRASTARGQHGGGVGLGRPRFAGTLRRASPPSPLSRKSCGLPADRSVGAPVEGPLPVGVDLRPLSVAPDARIRAPVRLPVA